jgi:signal transduction histidine kinase
MKNEEKITLSPSCSEKLDISDEVLIEWQKIVDLMADIIDVPTALINRVHPSEIEVFVASATAGNPYQKGSRLGLNTGLYCEEVMARRDKLLVLDARQDPKWAHSPALTLGMVSYLGFPLMWPDGEIFGTICVLDTKENPYSTTYVELMERFKGVVETNLRLLCEVADRRRAEAALRQRTVELQASNEELDAFAHTVAHNLKAPLNVIVGYSAVLEEDHATMPQEELRRFLSTIAQYGHKMGNIIDELFLLASARKMDEVEAGPLDMARIVAEAQARLAYLIREHQAEIVVPEAWPVALGYAPWVEEVWVNYLSNAVKYGGRPPRVELGAVEQADGTVRFWVRDNGPGLSPEDQARLFVPFTRLRQVRAEGHGLGLSIVLRIVQKMGGQVEVESQMGQGSVFAFTLPGERL